MNANLLVNLTSPDGSTRALTPMDLAALLNIDDYPSRPDQATKLAQALSNVWVWIGLGVVTVWGIS